ncbi:phosphodiester glycosidase family protein [Alicyclobacillus fastidiosus]|uniref:Phosphodiester glycosidase family protein n=1 Tax=Alicyclobacillus fastidiosus TaxID=392011 RepID=A0ABY6ZDB9_9BACL|nr:phosphodiester glycosidase family protein [Alicyclobacillus fastidiosus]WAH40890.1 phosphodiester glycosidase family protein [Alicyclobacillus fastidiosus]GMA62380.1 exopolysaccharide biosynthesis protein [Alicyclobacillus fastidiosus]
MQHQPERQTHSHTQLSQKARRAARGRRRKRRLIAASLSVFGVLLLLFGGSIGVAFGTPWGSHLRLLAAETVASTRHYEWARYLTTPSEYAQIMKELNGIAVRQSSTDDVSVANTRDIADVGGQPVQVIPLHQDGYTGYVMLVQDPKLVRLVPAQVHGSTGEYITDMAKRVGAIAGVNASGFEDPNGNGWGGIPVGLEYVNGTVRQSSKTDPSWATVGFTNDGVMVMGNYTTSDLAQIGVRDAMQFHPELVVDGQPTITQGDGGWGLDPRTAIGQERDGTVIFVVINGRLHGGHSIGASMKQVMDIMLKYHAVNACAMDGGSSSVLYDDGKILNSPSTLDPNGQRHLPDAWMVFPTEQAANDAVN